MRKTDVELVKKLIHVVMNEIEDDYNLVVLLAKQNDPYSPAIFNSNGDVEDLPGLFEELGTLVDDELWELLERTPNYKVDALKAENSELKNIILIHEKGQQ